MTLPLFYTHGIRLSKTIANGKGNCEIKEMAGEFRYYEPIVTRHKIIRNKQYAVTWTNV